jgi:hypothetical protein
MSRKVFVGCSVSTDPASFAEFGAHRALYETAIEASRTDSEPDDRYGDARDIEEIVDTFQLQCRFSAGSPGKPRASPRKSGNDTNSLPVGRSLRGEPCDYRVFERAHSCPASSRYTFRGRFTPPPPNNSELGSDTGSRSRIRQSRWWRRLARATR